jgi:hypothetical protein
MTNVIVRRKRSRMLLQIINGAEEVAQGNLCMKRIPKAMGSIPVHAAVFFRGGDLPIAWVCLAPNEFGLVIENEAHPHFETDATRYQIKQLILATRELRQAQGIPEPTSASGPEIEEGQGIRTTFEPDGHVVSAKVYKVQEG